MLAQAAAVRRLGISFRMPNALLAALTHRKTRLNPCDTAAEAGEPIAGAVFSKENGRYPKARPSLNREASRLGDVRVRRPSFRAQVPETYLGYRHPGNSPRCSIAPDGISGFSRLFTNGNWFWLVCKNRNAIAGPSKRRDNSPQS